MNSIVYRLNIVWSFFIRVVEDFACSVSLYSLGRSSVLSILVRSHFHNPWMDSASDAVLHLDVEFGDDISLEGSVFLKIFLGWGIDNVTNGETLNSFVLGTVTSAVYTDDTLDKPSVVFISAVISPLYGHVVNILINNISKLNLNIH